MKLFGGSAHASHLRKNMRQKRKGIPVLILCFLLLVILGACILRVMSKPPERAKLLQSGQTELPREPAAEFSKQQPESFRPGVYNILLCGTDENGARSDTVMVLNLNCKTGAVSLLSIPRDTWIFADYDIPKLNSAYAYGGITELKQQLQQLLGFPVDAYVSVDMTGFVKLVDLLGGVEFDVPQDMSYSDPTQDLEIHLKKGKQRLNGEQALQLVRYRNYPTADISRIGVQQNFLRALAKQCVTPANLTKLGAVLELARKEVRTDLSMNHLLWFAEQLLFVNFDTIRTYTPEGQGVMIDHLSYYALFPGSLLRIVNEGFNPYDRALTERDLKVRTWRKSDEQRDRKER